MSVYQWSKGQTIRFLKTYKKHECLWNPQNIEFKCRDTRQDAWKQISNTLGIEVNELKRKIKNLLLQYNRERLKCRKRIDSGIEPKYMYKWFAYRYMTFIPPRDGGDRDTINANGEKIEHAELDTDDTKESDSYNEYEDDDEYSEPDEMELQETIKTEEPVMLDCDSNQLIEVDVEQQLKRNANGNLKQLNGSNEALTKHVVSNENPSRHQETNYIAPQQQHQQQQQMQIVHGRDRFNIFGDYIAYRIRSLNTEYAQDSVEHMISNILWQASNGKFDHPSYNNNRPAQVFLSGIMNNDK